MQLQIFRTAQQLFDKEGQTFKSLCSSTRACVWISWVHSSFINLGQLHAVSTRAAGGVVHKSLFTWLVVWSTRACVRVHKSLFTWLVVWSTSSRACLRGWLCGPQELAYAGDCEKFLCACGHSGDCELNVWLWTHWRL